MSSKGSIVIGVLVGLVSTSVQSLGLTLQRKSHLLEDEKESQDHRRPPYRRRRWQIGLSLFIVSNVVGSTIQITTLPLPVLSTLQASGLVFNSVCASLILGEPFTRYSLVGTILVSGGAILIAIFGAIGEPAHTLDQLLDLLGRRQFVLWMAGQAILVVAIILGVRALKAWNPYHGSTPRMRLIRGMAYGCISGILSAHSLLVAKSAVELLVRTISDGKNQFNRWQSWVILLTLIALTLSQLYYLNRGLKLCSTSILYPFVFCMYNIIAILDGLIYFRQTSRLSLLSALLIGLGTVILLLGVLALSWRLSDDHASKVPLTQTPLTPSLGLMAPDTDDTDSEVDSEYMNEESRTFSYTGPRKASNGYGTISRLVRHASNPTTPSARHSALFAPPRRRPTQAEVDEIWDELEEDSPAPTPAASPFLPHRSISARSMPTKPPLPGPRDHLHASDSDSDSDQVQVQNQNHHHPDLSSSIDIHTGLLQRASTGRSYRERRRPRLRIPSTGSLSSAQPALGGWWRLRWWKADKGKRPDVGDTNGGETMA